MVEVSSEFLKIPQGTPTDNGNIFTAKKNKTQDKEAHQ